LAAPQDQQIDDISVHESLRRPANVWTLEMYRQYEHRITPTRHLSQFETSQTMAKKELAEAAKSYKYSRDQRVQRKRQNRMPFRDNPMAICAKKKQIN